MTRLQHDYSVLTSHLPRDWERLELPASLVGAKTLAALASYGPVFKHHTGNTSTGISLKHSVDSPAGQYLIIMLGPVIIIIIFNHCSEHHNHQC